jgi:thiol-disulfide isomerase/thioredoxin
MRITPAVNQTALPRAATLALLLLAPLAASAQSRPDPSMPPGAPDRRLFSEEGVPVPGDPAPSLKLPVLDGRKDVDIAAFQGKKPVVLLFTSYTCPPFRREAARFERMYQDYKDRAEFFLVYVREIHPSDGWQLPENEREKVLVRQPVTRAQRAAVARTCREKLKLTMPILMDTMSDDAQKAWHAWPGRAWLVGSDGRLAWRGCRAPNLAIENLNEALRDHLRRAGISDEPSPKAAVADLRPSIEARRKDE